MRKLKAAELVLDFTLYPRNNVDSSNVRSLVNAREAGIQLPPVIIEKKSKRVVDGVHRVKAAIQHGGDDATVEVIERVYKNDGELFADAMRYNSSHGAKLDQCDRTHCVIIAERLGLSLDIVAGALHMPVDKLGALRADRMATSGGMSVPLKRTVRHFAGRDLTKRQLEANTKLSGMNQVFYVNQVIELIEAKMIDMDDGPLAERLKRLHELLEEMLVAS